MSITTTVNEAKNNGLSKFIIVTANVNNKVNPMLHKNGIVRLGWSLLIPRIILMLAITFIARMIKTMTEITVVAINRIIIRSNLN